MNSGVIFFSWTCDIEKYLYIFMRKENEKAVKHVIIVPSKMLPVWKLYLHLQQGFISLINIILTSRFW